MTAYKCGFRAFDGSGGFYKTNTISGTHSKHANLNDNPGDGGLVIYSRVDYDETVDYTLNATSDGIVSDLGYCVAPSASDLSFTGSLLAEWNNSVGHTPSSYSYTLADVTPVRRYGFSYYNDSPSTSYFSQHVNNDFTSPTVLAATSAKKQFNWVYDHSITEVIRTVGGGTRTRVLVDTFAEHELVTNTLSGEITDAILHDHAETALGDADWVDFGFLTEGNVQASSFYVPTSHESISLLQFRFRSETLDDYFTDNPDDREIGGFAEGTLTWSLVDYDVDAGVEGETLATGDINYTREEPDSTDWQVVDLPVLPAHDTNLYLTWTPY